MIAFLKNRFQLSLALLIIVYMVGIVTVLLGHTDALMLLTPYNLLFAAGLLIYNAEGFDKKYGSWLLVVILAGFFVELLGIETGLIFGEYSYGNGLGLKWLDVPLMIGINWGVLVFATAAMVHPLKLSKWLKAVIAATLMVSYDILLEPVAVRFDFWSWAGGTIPLQNYLAWWIIAFLMLLGAFYWVKNLRNRLAFYIIGVQTLFFLLLIVDQQLTIR
ncbi:MAG: carotenoid biosynthesis protein [Bacteroidetes bacterium]|nr:carotenoid biosynthesis protein [Bacteroidota bacterium]MBU1579556.1 carotenoid biosynthesis protein [Bacteroidota bacterium]MBU2557488.1 carotenoid biosynthesis protein [Bacteroidota bacterium]